MCMNCVAVAVQCRVKYIRDVTCMYRTLINDSMSFVTIEYFNDA